MKATLELHWDLFIRDTIETKYECVFLTGGKKKKKKSAFSFKMDRTLAAPQEDAQIHIGHKIWCMHNFWVNPACCCIFRRWMDLCWFYLQLREHACKQRLFIDFKWNCRLFSSGIRFPVLVDGVLVSAGHYLNSFHIQPRLGCVCQPSSSVKVKLRGAAMTM